MLERSLTHLAGQGWSAPLPAELDSPDTLVLVFAGPDAATTAPLADLASAFPLAVIAGCSSAGEIAGAQVQDDSLSVAVARFEHTHLRWALTAIDGAADSLAAGSRLAAQLAAPQEGAALRAVFVLSDGLGVNGSGLVAGLSRALPAGVTVSGGLAGDGARFARTWIIERTRRLGGHVGAVGFYGERLRVGHGCDAGWSDFGPERRITRAEGNVLYELDGRPALELYKTYLGERAAGLPGTALLFPLAVRRDEHDPHLLVRTILGVDEATQSMTFAGDLPQGGIGRLMRANTDRLIGSAESAAASAMHALPPGRPALVVSVSCVGRRLVLGERTEEEVETVQASAPERCAHVGFYSYGEISPMDGGAAELHNQTMTVTAFCED